MSHIDLYFPAFTSTFENLTYPVCPPLGLMQLAAVLREAGHACRIVDLRLERHPARALDRLWKEHAPDLVGVSCVTHMARVAYALVARCKERLPGVPVVIGGPHVTAYGRDVMRECAADVGVRGEGEPVVVRLVESLLAGELDRGLPNIMYRQGGEVVMNEEVRLVEDLDGLPAPAWDLADLDAYSKRQAMSLLPNRRYAPIMSSRGCPYRCTYCHNMFGKKVRFLGVARFVDQLEHLHRDLGVRHFEIDDDVFNIDKRRVLAICGEIRRRGMRIRLAFPNGLRSDLLDRETIDALYEAGTRFICYAVESASPRIQMLVEKNLDLAKAAAAIDYAASRGIVGCGFFMLGFPTETEAELRQTIDFAVGSRLHLALFFIVTPYKGTRLGEEFKAPGGHPIEYTMLNYDYGDAAAADVPMKTIVRLREEAIRRFYIHPARIARLAVSYPMLHKVPRTAMIAILRVLRRRLIQHEDGLLPGAA